MKTPSVRRIHDGATATVYLRESSEGTGPEAVKALRSEFPARRERDRFANEFDITSSLDIPGVRKAFRKLTFAGRPAMALEYVEGRTVGELLGDGPPPLETFLRLAVQMADILAEIHGRDVVHGNIHPGNLLVETGTGRVRFIDFGLASRLTPPNRSLAPPETLEGNPAYMAPERTGRTNRAIDSRADLYSLGVVFYEMLTGKPPFEAGDALGMVHCHLARKPVPPCEGVPPKTGGNESPAETETTGCPAALSAIVMKLLAKSAEDRYASAHGLKADLVHCLERLADLPGHAGFVPGARDVSDRFRIPAKLYGRETERAAFAETLDRVARSGRELLLVAGSSGAGKSTLAHEALAAGTARRGYFIS